MMLVLFLTGFFNYFALASTEDCIIHLLPEPHLIQQHELLGISFKKIQEYTVELSIDSSFTNKLNILKQSKGSLYILSMLWMTPKEDLLKTINSFYENFLNLGSKSFSIFIQKKFILDFSKKLEDLNYSKTVSIETATFYPTAAALTILRKEKPIVVYRGLNIRPEEFKSPYEKPFRNTVGQGNSKAYASLDQKTARKYAGTEGIILNLQLPSGLYFVEGSRYVQLQNEVSKNLKNFIIDITDMKLEKDDESF